MPYVPLHVVREHAVDESEGRQQQVRVVTDIGVLQHQVAALNALLTIRILFSLSGMHPHEGLQHRAWSVLARREHT
eukprot:2216988-Pyramimonas_sp.AAC.1